MGHSARQQLDNRLSPIRTSGWPERPRKGWIRAIRDALGMTSQQLAHRLGVSQVRVTALEKQETLGTLKLETLENAAKALNCTLVYAFIPNEPLQTMVQNQAVHKAQQILKQTQHTMALEQQGLTESHHAQMLQATIHSLLQGSEARLWD